jgi:predicted O-methyltransferase YrrM
MHVPDIKLYRKIRYRKGYGVHSPFVYNLITKVIEEKTPFYAFEEIEHFRKKLLSGKNELSIITAKETQHANYGKFLFRMVNFFKCRNIIQIGSSTGVMGLYLTLASRTQSECYLLEERSGLMQAVTDFALAHNLKKLHFREGAYEETLKTLQATIPEADLIFINQIPNSIEIEKVILLCKPLIKKTSILILNDIVKNKKVKNFWQLLKSHPQTRVMMDLYALGIIFFNDKLPKQHYKTYFNHGKKQNLYTKRRRGLYFIGRRKKSSQNQSEN